MTVCPLCCSHVAFVCLDVLFIFTFVPLLLWDTHTNLIYAITAPPTVLLCLAVLQRSKTTLCLRIQLDVTTPTGRVGLCWHSAPPVILPAPSTNICEMVLFAQHGNHLPFLFIHAGARQTIIAELQTAPPTHMAQMCPTWQPERKQAAQTEPHTWEVCEHHLPPVWFLLAGRCCHITEAVCLICLC